MHNWAKSIMECVKSKVDSMGMDNLNREDVEELKAWACIAKDVAEYDYYYHITEAMEKPENEYGVNYDENGKYYTPSRGMNGRFKRGYDESYDMTPMHYRDMDMHDGRMYYTESSNMGSNMNRGYSEGRYERARRGYEESKNMNMASENMEELKEMFMELKKDMKELKPKMTPSEMSYSRSELTNLANTMM